MKAESRQRAERECVRDWVGLCLGRECWEGEGGDSLQRSNWFEGREKRKEKEDGVGKVINLFP